MAGENKDETREGAWLAQWESVANRFESLTQQLTEPSVLKQPTLLCSLNKERADIEEISHLFFSYQKILQEISETERLLDDSKLDPELRVIGEQDLQTLSRQREETERNALELLHPKNADDEKNTFLEIRAGTGGEEAALCR